MPTTRKKKPSKNSGTHVALLRGINVGGKNKLPMKMLSAIFREAGARDVRTYIQSGNVVYSASAALARRIPPYVSAAIKDRFGYFVPVQSRSAREIEAVALGNPFLARKVDESKLHVAFLASIPTAARVRALDPDRSPPDEFLLRGRDLFLYLPNGAARTKLTNVWFDRSLATVSTVRNWRTVQKLVALSAE